MAQITLNKAGGGQLTLAPEDGTSNKTIVIPDSGLGKVLQTKRLVDTSRGTYTTSSWVATPLSMVFTPVSATSKLIITVHTHLGGDSGGAEGAGARLYRDGTLCSDIGSENWAAHGATAGFSGDDKAPTSVSFSIEETLGSTGTVTYTMYIKGYSSNYPVGYNQGRAWDSDGNGRWVTPSSITIVEVAA